jgi:cellulose synthase (UDP-forming)
MAVCVELPRYRREERFTTSETVGISTGDREFTTPLEDISILGARILGPAPGSPRDVIWIKLDHVGEIAARIVYGTEKYFAVEFIDADSKRDALIRKVFSGRYDRQLQDVQAHGVFGALLARMLR